MKLKELSRKITIGALVGAAVGLFYIMLIIYLSPNHTATFDMNSLGEAHLEILSLGMIVMLGLQFYWEELKK